VGAAVAIGGLLLINVNEQKKRERDTNQAQQRAAEVESAARADEARRSRRQQVREARIRQAEIQNTAAGAGQTGSSAAISAGDSLQSQLGTNIGSINAALMTGTAKTIAQQDIYNASRPSTTELLSGAGLQLGASYLGGKG